MNSGVYKITNKVNGKYYIGSSSDCKERWKNHLKALRGGYHENDYLQNAFNKYGEDNFVFEVLDILPIEEIRKKEQWYIDHFYDQMYNLSKLASGGDLISYHPNHDLIVEKITKSIKQRYKNITEEDRQKQWGWMNGKGNPMYGHHHSVEANRKISEAHIGNHYNKGIKRSEETKKKLSEIAKKRVGEKNPFYGHHHSDKTKKNLSEKFKGRIPVNAKRVLIDEKEYASANEAARQLNILPSTLTHRIRSSNPKYSNYRYIG